MILVARETGSKELLPIIRRLGVHADLHGLQFGDFAFEGNGPDGKISIGVERKTLHDMLHCIDDSRLAGHQLVGMGPMYTFRFLIVEGNFKPHDPNGDLMEGFRGGTSWGVCRYRSRRTMYSKLRRYLFSVSLGGTHVLYSRDIVQTAWDICELYHYFEKRWEDHTSLMAMQKFTLPSLSGPPSLCRWWAYHCPDIGDKLSEEAVKLFRNNPLKLALATASEWEKIRGVGSIMSSKIIKAVRGTK